MLTDQHTVALIVGNLPAVGRMDLFDVDDVELYVGSEALVNTIEGRNLRPERRSSIAPEDQRDRSLAGMIGEANTPGTRLVIQTAQFEIRRSVTGLRCVWLDLHHGRQRFGGRRMAHDLDHLLRADIGSLWATCQPSVGWISLM